MYPEEQPGPPSDGEAEYSTTALEEAKHQMILAVNHLMQLTLKHQTQLCLRGGQGNLRDKLPQQLKSYSMN